MAIKHSDAFGTTKTKVGSYDANLFTEIPSEDNSQPIEDVPVIKQKVKFSAFMEKRKKEEEEFLKQKETKKKPELEDVLQDFTNIDSDNLFDGIQQSQGTIPKGDGIARFHISENTINVEDCQNIYTDENIFVIFEIKGFTLAMELIGFTEDFLAVFVISGMQIKDNENIIYDHNNNCYYLLVPVKEFKLNDSVNFKINSENAVYSFKELNRIIEKIKILDVYAVNVEFIN